MGPALPVAFVPFRKWFSCKTPKGRNVRSHTRGYDTTAYATDQLTVRKHRALVHEKLLRLNTGTAQVLAVRLAQVVLVLGHVSEPARERAWGA